MPCHERGQDPRRQVRRIHLQQELRRTSRPRCTHHLGRSTGSRRGSRERENNGTLRLLVTIASKIEKIEQWKSLQPYNPPTCHCPSRTWTPTRLYRPAS